MNYGTRNNSSTRSNRKTDNKNARCALPLLPEDQQIFESFLLSISKQEKKVERFRQSLSTEKLFVPHSAFQRINRCQDNKLTSIELLRFLRSNNVEDCSEADTACLIDHFKTTEAEGLNFEDFLQMVLPCDNPKLRSQAVTRDIQLIQKQSRLPEPVETELTRMLEQEVQYQRMTEKFKQTFAASKTFNYESAFHTIDDWGFGYINLKNLKNFFRNRGQKLSQVDCNYIIRRLDTDCDGKLSKSEFMIALEPSQPCCKVILSRQITESKKQSSQSATPHSRNNTIKGSISNTLQQSGPSSLQPFMTRQHSTKKIGIGGPNVYPFEDTQETKKFPHTSFKKLKASAHDPVQVHALDRIFTKAISITTTNKRESTMKKLSQTPYTIRGPNITHLVKQQMHGTSSPPRNLMAQQVRGVSLSSGEQAQEMTPERNYPQNNRLLEHSSDINYSPVDTTTMKNGGIISINDRNHQLDNRQNHQNHQNMQTQEERSPCRNTLDGRHIGQMSPSSISSKSPTHKTPIHQRPIVEHLGTVTDQFNSPPATTLQVQEQDNDDDRDSQDLPLALVSSATPIVNLGVLPLQNYQVKRKSTDKNHNQAPQAYQQLLQPPFRMKHVGDKENRTKSSSAHYGQQPQQKQRVHLVKTFQSDRKNKIHQEYYPQKVKREILKDSKTNKTVGGNGGGLINADLGSYEKNNVKSRGPLVEEEEVPYQSDQSNIERKEITRRDLVPVQSKSQLPQLQGSVSKKECMPSILRKSTCRSSISKSKKQSLYTQNQKDLTVLGRQSDKLFAQKLIQIMHLEQDLEVFKIDLSLVQDFNLQEIVKAHDPEKHYNLTRFHIRKLFENSNLFLSDEDLKLVFARICAPVNDFTPQVEKVNYNELSNCYLPNDPYYANKLIVKRLQMSRPMNASNSNSHSQEGVWKMCVKYWKLLRDTECKIEEIKLEIFEMEDFTLEKAFKSLDFNRDGQVSQQDLRQYFKEFGVTQSQLNKDQIFNLVRRFTSKRSAQISFKEFKQGMLPILHEIVGLDEGIQGEGQSVTSEDITNSRNNGSKSTLGRFSLIRDASALESKQQIHYN